MEIPDNNQVTPTASLNTSQPSAHKLSIKLVIFITFVILLLIIALGLLFWRNGPCKPTLSNRTTDRKTGIVAFERNNGSLENIGLFYLGEKKITRSSFYNVPQEEHFLRGGRVLSVDLQNKTIVLDVGDNNNMIIQVSNKKGIRIKKSLIKYARPVVESYIENANICDIEKDDLVGIILNDKNLKEYNKIIQVSTLELVL